ncbi:MAG: alanine racemase [Bacillota bacterium]|nr:alanine racemase [Bacillota bacterium]
MRQTYARVDLGAFSHNIQAVRQAIGKDVMLMAVVKADAYGHGLCRMAERAEKDGVDYLAVALAEEGLALRKAGITLPILVLAGLSEESTDMAVEAGLTLTVFTKDHLRFAESSSKKHHKPALAHIKLDTGMNRIGVKSRGELKSLLQTAKGLKNVRITGAFTHFACADAVSADHTLEQFKRFNALAEELPDGLLLHASGTSALLRFPETRLNMVRAGIALYGYSPVSTTADLKPVLSWFAEITHIKTAQKGEYVSYGATIHLQRDTRIATLAVGYGDGYNRGLSNKASVLVGGVRCPVLGRVCMDQIMADITDAGDVQIGDKAVLLGQSGGERIDALDLADMLNTIPYEVLLSITSRVPRIYED